VSKKPFSQSLYDSDDTAKDQIVDYFNGQGWKAYVNPDQYGIDVLATDPQGKEHKFEVEVKHNWKGPKFQYSTLHYSDRKRKFLDTPENTAFITLNHERTHALMVAGNVLADAETIVKDTIYTKGEKFIEVNTVDCELIDLADHAQKVRTAEWLQARSELVGILVQNGIVETKNDIAGFPSVDEDGNETWVSIYDLMEK
jgi:hypothetical protein